ncbi:YggS family pyridoxal phosphate-dependent enzyme [Acinetobacter sp. HY1485]|uniref:YggS family pyridoxal phosphate-dependent enzyme n=1 Tax=Acinetobacter sp. HY1485 TaxID=2970918 RepID=UPI0022B9CAE0|nr:YggS family pyridoxal phosphate-dependent enzyme [Acinetobacter sp. HY1485]
MMQSRQNVLEQVRVACELAKRSTADVELLAVSKKQSSDVVRSMFETGQHSFGENYLQEALGKIHDLSDLEITWHFIGHVQRNKTKQIAENFAWVHGVDRFIIAQRLSNQRPAHLPQLNICIQVNIDHQDSKDGCLPNDVADLVKQMSVLPQIRLRGLMVIPAPNNTQAFTQAKQLFDTVKTSHANPQDWDTLSMGMSGDLSEAIGAGSTMVRVGTALFGVRS